MMKIELIMLLTAKQKDKYIDIERKSEIGRKRERDG